MSGIGQPTPLLNYEGDRTLYAVLGERADGTRVEIVHSVRRGQHIAQIVACRPGRSPFVIAIAQVATLIEALTRIEASIREARREARAR